MYTYTYTSMSKVKTVQQKQSTVDWPGQKRKPKIVSTRTKLKHKLENKTKARCQLVNKAMKIKLTKCSEERKERKNGYAKLNRGKSRFIYVKD